VRGFGFSVEALGDDVLQFDAYATGLSSSIPVIVRQGRDDRVTPYGAAEEFLRNIRAPAKRFVPIDGGHFACYTNPEAFVLALTEHLTPLID
jgi:pimeloyl-ACP methyl ester carboxylesterase